MIKKTNERAHFQLLFFNFSEYVSTIILFYQAVFISFTYKFLQQVLVQFIIFFAVKRAALL